MPRFLRIQEGWLTVGLLALLLFSVTLSIQHAQWSDGLSILTPITLIGLLSGVVLAKVRGVPRFLLDMVGLLIGLITVLIAVASIMRDPRLTTVQDRVQDLLARTSAWIGVAVRQEMSDDLVVFILSLAVVTWVLAYSSAYFVFRSRQLWWALVPNGVALLINLSYSVVNINGYIIVFMFSALLIMIRFNLLTKEERWQRERVNYSPGLTWAFLWTGSAVSVALALSMWFVPATSVNGTLNSMWEQVNQPWVDFQSSMSRLWSQLPGNQGVGGYSSFSDSFTMGGALSLSQSVALTVKSRESLYLRATTYDKYNGVGWENTAEDTINVPNLSSRLFLAATQQLVSTDAARSEVTYTVTLASPKRDIIFTALSPVRLSTDSRLDVSWRPLNETYDLDTLYEGTGTVDTLPLELRTAVGLLRGAQIELRDPARSGPDGENGMLLINTTSKARDLREEISDLSARGVNLTYGVTPAPQFKITVTAFGEVPVYGDISAVRSLSPLPRNEAYTAVSQVSRATADDLQAADTAYEPWLSRYVEVPAKMSPSIAELAATVVRDATATTPYDEARAIETYLRENYTYSTDISTPPVDTDPLEWFLFQGKEGYCTYYAGSMVLMLRTLGVPARLATGYAPGSFDAPSGTYVVRESAAHAWPEVYFPGYGWVNFEPTPSQVVVSRDTPDASAQLAPTPELTVEAEETPLDDEEERNLEERRQQEAAAAAAQAAQGGGPSALLWVAGALALAGLGAALLFLFPFSPLRRKAPASASAYYARMLRWAQLVRLGPSTHQTPFEFSEALAREVRGTSMFTRAIARAYVRERFSGKPATMSERVTLSRSWDTLRGRLWRKLPAQHVRRIRKH